MTNLNTINREELRVTVNKQEMEVDCYKSPEDLGRKFMQQALAHGYTLDRFDEFMNEYYV